MLSFNAIPIDKYSSLHKIAILRLLGIKTNRSPRLAIGFNFNLGILPSIPKAQVIFNLRDNLLAPSQDADFHINNLTRWRLDISKFNTFTDFLQTLKSNHKRNYRVTEEAFEEHGACLTLIDDDWSQYVDTVYQLYLNVAKRNGSQLYDLNYFRTIAKIKEYHLICLWHHGKLISTLIIYDEAPTYHSMLCGFDYNISKKIHAYSYLHYELIRLAIEKKEYQTIDAGITANHAKSMIHFQPISSCMDIYAQNRLAKMILRLLSRFTEATINDQSKLKFKFHF